MRPMQTKHQGVRRLAVLCAAFGGLVSCATVRSAPAAPPAGDGRPSAGLVADAGTDAPRGDAARGPGAAPTRSGPDKWLTQDEVTLERLLAIFREAYAGKARIDNDGELEISDGNMKHWIRIDTRRQIITFSAPWALKKSAPEEKKLALVNTLNDKLLFVRFCVSDSTTLWPDYQLSYEGGIAVHSIVVAFRNFVQIMLEAVHNRDPDDLIGSD